MKLTLEEIAAHLAPIRQYLAADGGDIELVELTPDGVLYIRLLGSCRTCDLNSTTVQLGILEPLQRLFPTLKAIKSYLRSMNLRLALTATLLFVGGCEKINLPEGQPLSDEEVVAGLKEALRIGTDTTVRYLNRLDGYYGDTLIRILFPEEAWKVKLAIEALPGGAELVQDLVIKMNRAAEEAAAEAKPIFWQAIAALTIQDGMAILKGDSVAATRYLRERTYDSLYALQTQDSGGYGRCRCPASVGVHRGYLQWAAYYAHAAGEPRPGGLCDPPRLLYGLFLKVGQHETEDSPGCALSGD